jgi:hypothetical protein
MIPELLEVLNHTCIENACSDVGSKLPGISTYADESPVKPTLAPPSTPDWSSIPDVTPEENVPFIPAPEPSNAVDKDPSFSGQNAAGEAACTAATYELEPPINAPADRADADPYAFVAVTSTATHDPASEDCTVYVDDVAPEMLEHDDSAPVVQSFH